MRLALHTDYALRTLIFLAGRPERTSVADVAAFYAISRDHVAKVVQSLARHGYVRSIRGGGGIELARRPDEITIGQVIEDFEGNLHLLECVSTQNLCVIQPGCKLRLVLAEAERLQVEYLNSVRLCDVVRPGGQLLEITGPEGGRSEVRGQRSEVGSRSAAGGVRGQKQATTNSAAAAGKTRADAGRRAGRR